MKEFVEKLIERLEEEGKYHLELSEANKMDVRESHRHKSFASVYGKAIQIVKDLAEEHNNGWISVDDELPENMQECLTTANIYFVPNHVDEPNSHIGVELNVYSKKYGWLHNTNVIAWQPLPAPYKKGE